MSLPAYLIEDLPTPSIVIDLEAVDHNIEVANRMLHGTSIALRPHFKAHKCRPLLHRQLCSGRWSGVTCQTAFEALVLARDGFHDILVTNQIVDRLAVEQLMSAARLAKVTTVIDSAMHIDLLQRATERANVELFILIEIDVGLGRCGLRPGDPTLIDLAATITRTCHLSFAGLQAYEGHAVQIPATDERASATSSAATIANDERKRLAAVGYPCGIVTGGGTGTLHLAVDNHVLDEVQAGSYVLMDATYARLNLPFRQALFCLATVISTRDDHSAVVDAGLKQLSAEAGFAVSTDPRLETLGMSDEHTRFAVSDGAEYVVGDRVQLIPSHVDPTMNLHSTVFAASRDGVQEWPIDRRTMTLSGGLA
jgi:D-serine deaminase-like pyridoxal phosphate-dependent protein